MTALAFACWLGWPIVVAQMPAGGFRFSANQLYWLAALPALCGACWRFVQMATHTAVTTRGSAAVLAAACVAMIVAGQRPQTAYETLVALALLCGLGVARVLATIGEGTALPAAPPAADEDFAQQAQVFTRRHNWLLGWLYVGTFGSAMGFVAAAPLLLAHPLAGCALLPGVAASLLARPLGAWLADRMGAGRVTTWSFLALLAGSALLLHGSGTSAGGTEAPAMPLLPLQLLSLALILGACGVGQGSVLRMFPRVFAGERRLPRETPASPASPASRDASAAAADQARAALHFASAVGGFGGFVVPKALGSSLALTASTAAAGWLFIAFYASCASVCWWHYGRRFAARPC